MSDVASAFLNIPVHDSNGFIYVQARQEVQYPEPTVWRLKRQLYGLRESPIMTDSFDSGSQQMRSDPCAFTRCDSSGHINLIVMAYVDASLSQESHHQIKDSFRRFRIKHIDYVTPDHLVEFLGRIIKKQRSGQITMEFSQKFIDNLLGLFRITSRVTTNGVKLPMVPKEDQVRCGKENHSLFRTAVGKLLWMSQLRDDIKYPVKELSRSVSNPQESDFDNLKHLLKYVNQTSSSWSVRFQPRILKVSFQLRFVSYSDSDWAGCQKLRRSTSGSLITLFSVNIASTSRTQASSVSFVSRS